MFLRAVLLSLLLAVSLLAAACVPIPPATPSPAVGLPNPASVFCAENGGEVDLRTDATGAAAGVCVFPDGSECDEWAYFRDECAPGDSLVTPAP
jgi:putative hemolysin